MILPQALQKLALKSQEHQALGGGREDEEILQDHTKLDFTVWPEAGIFKLCP